MLLLRPAVESLVGEGHRVSLLAPTLGGAALCGPGGASARLQSDGPELAAALADGFADGPVARAVAQADAVVAYSRSAPVLDLLATRARRLIVRDPSPPESGPHAALWYAEAVAPLLARFVPAADLTAVLRFTELERHEAAELTNELSTGFLALHPGSGSPAKNWPLDRFLEAARRLAAGARWLFVTGPAEQALETPADAVPAREWPPRVLGAALARAGLYLGNDSGVSHLAAAAGAPTLALFGPTDPSLWAPIGPRVATLRAPAAAMAGLEVDAVVLDAARLRSAASGLPSG